MAKHFCGRVKYFEIWNEENGWFFDSWADKGSVRLVKAYGKALAAAAKAIKKVNPEALVMFGGTAGTSLDFSRIALAEGAGPYIDIVAFHPYGHLTPDDASVHFLTAVEGKMQWKPRPADIDNYEKEIAAYRKMLYKHNPNMQIWANEMNWFAPGEPAGDHGDQSELSQGKHLARFYALNGWLGTGAVWWSLYNANHIQEWAVLRSSDGSPRAAYYSAGYVSTVLDDCKGVSDVKTQILGTPPDDLAVKVYRNGNGQMIIGLWRKSNPVDNYKSVPVTLSLPEIKIAKAELVDSLYGYKQKALVKLTGATGTQIPELLVGDWPLFIRIQQ